MSSCRQCRAENTKLFLKGDRCLTAKCPITQKKKGSFGKARRGKTSYYGLQLREKQKLKRFYGVSESQFRKYYAIAAHAVGNTGEILIQSLERRLDNIVYRSGLAVSRSQARQMVSHGLFNLNNKMCNIPSLLVAIEDVVSLKENKKQITMVEANLSREYTVPQWLNKKDDYHVVVQSFPVREDMVDLEVKEQLIIELYSR